MTLRPLFDALAEVFDRPEAIERAARNALLDAADRAGPAQSTVPLARPFLDVMSAADAHPVCATIADTPLPWAPPQTSDDPQYTAHSLPKVHVELLGPDGLVRSDRVRLGLYGILPGAEYGIRTHPAEEVFVMLAGRAFWKRDDAPYEIHGPGERSYHPSMMPHATRTGDVAFLSAYVWIGDISTDQYVYEGLPDG